MLGSRVWATFTLLYSVCLCSSTWLTTPNYKAGRLFCPLRFSSQPVRLTHGFFHFFLILSFYFKHNAPQNYTTVSLTGVNFFAYFFFKCGPFYSATLCQRRDKHGLGPSMGWVGLSWVAFSSTCDWLGGLG